MSALRPGIHVWPSRPTVQPFPGAFQARRDQPRPASAAGAPPKNPACAAVGLNAVCLAAQASDGEYPDDDSPADDEYEAWGDIDQDPSQPAASWDVWDPLDDETAEPEQGDFWPELPDDE